MPEAWQFVSYNISTGTGMKPTVTLRLKRGEEEVREQMICGDGPVDAIFLAMAKITGVNVVCRDFRVQAITVGNDAQGEVNVEVEHNGQLYRGRGVSTDSVEASAKAFMNAINRVAIDAAPRLHPQHSVAS
jgi:2-isopropylmalate synthase